MPLPKISVPEYITELPSTKEEVKYHPFLVKQEKLFLIAQNSGKQKDIVNTVKRIIKDCVTSKTKVEDMTIFDIEYLFINLRARSEGEELSLTVVCPDDKTTEVDVTINIDDIKVNFNKKHTNQIDLDNGMKFVMRYPNIDTLLKVSPENEGDLSDAENVFKMTELCLKEVYHEDDIYNFQEYTKEEKDEFLNSLSSKDYKKLLLFFETMPSLQHQIKVKNPKTKKDNTITLKGIYDFL